MPTLRAVPAGFVEHAPEVWVFEAVLAAPQDQVFAAIVADPATWKDWFPGFGAGGYVGEPGLGCGRWVKVGGLRYDETVVEWDEPTRWTYRVDATSIPMARALVERWDVQPYGRPYGQQTLVRWTFALDPGPFFKLSAPIAPSVMRRLFERAMRRLDQQLSARRSPL